jgi:putative ABC transport system permease protein
MLKSILVSAFRNIVRNKSFSFINLVGLSVSMSLALLVMLILREQYTYDNFHRDADRIFRVNTRALRAEGGSEDYASTPLPIAGALQEEYTFTEEVVRVNRRLNGDAVYGNTNVPFGGLFVDPSFLKVFNFPLEKGNPATALGSPEGVVLTQVAAKKLFGDEEALGKTFHMGSYGVFTVTGILKPFASKTHFEFEILASMKLVPALEARGVLSKATDNWNNYYSNYVYLKLKDGIAARDVTNALTEINKKYYSNLTLETRDRGYEFFLLPLSEITPGPEMSNQMGTGMPLFLITFLTILVAIVMVMACFNYTNLTIAKSIARAREIGVRKVVGAQRLQVFGQFIGEAVVFSLVALALSYRAPIAEAGISATDHGA